MKNHYLLFTIFFLCALQSNAQVTIQPGVRGGINFADLTETDASYKTDFYAGGLLAINFTKRYTLQPEIIYSKQGADNVDTYYYDFATDSYIEGEDDIEVNYISIAAMNKFTIVKGLHVMVGPTFDFLVNTNMASQESDIDLAIVTGFGYKFPSGLSLEFRFKKGIADVVNDEYYEGGDGFFFGDYNSNLLFQVGAAYYFDLK